MARQRRKPNKGKSNIQGGSNDREPKTTTSSTGAAEEEKLTKESDAKEKGKNDPAWYTRDERLVIDSASIPFSNPFGSAVQLHVDPRGVASYGTHNVRNVAGSENVGKAPGIMVYKIAPSYGDSSNILSPMNVAANALYSHVRYVNNGRKNYDPADLFIYLIAITEVYSYLAWMRRIYGCIFPYSQANWYVGRNLVEAQGVNSDDLLKNLAKFRYWINVFTNKIAAYAIPADLPLIFRRVFQFSSVYLEHDGDSVKDQMYMYVPQYFFKFGLDYKGKGSLKLVDPYVTGLLSVDKLIEFGENLLSSFLGDEDFGLMSGDILKAFDNAIVRLDPLPEDYIVVPIHDKMVLTQMENSIISNVLSRDPGSEPANEYFTFNGMDEKFTPNCILQTADGLLVSKWVSKAKLNPNGGSPDFDNGVEALFDKVLNIHEATGDPALVIESIQNMVATAVENTQGLVLSWSQDIIDDVRIIMYPGAAIVTSAYCYYFHDVAGSFLTSTVVKQDLDTTVRPINDHWEWCRNMMAFKYAPKVFTMQMDPQSGDLEVYYHHLMGRLDTYAVIPNDTLRNLLQTSLLSLLYVPGVAKYINSLS